MNQVVPVLLLFVVGVAAHQAVNYDIDPVESRIQNLKSYLTNKRAAINSELRRSSILWGKRSFPILQPQNHLENDADYIAGIESENEEVVKRDAKSTLRKSSRLWGR